MIFDLINDTKLIPDLPEDISFHEGLTRIVKSINDRADNSGEDGIAYIVAPEVDEGVLLCVGVLSHHYSRIVKVWEGEHTILYGEEDDVQAES